MILYPSDCVICWGSHTGECPRLDESLATNGEARDQTTMSNGTAMVEGVGRSDEHDSDGGRSRATDGDCSWYLPPFTTILP